MGQKLTIGKVAAAACVNVETIRFYQRRGLLAEPTKQLAGLRYYDPDAIERVRFIKRAQALGFSLEEVVGLLALQQSNSCQQTHDAAVQKLQLVERRIADLRALRTILKGLVQRCAERKTDDACPIIDSLSNPA